MSKTCIDIKRHVYKEMAMPYRTFGSDMKAAGKEMGQLIKDGGSAVRKNIRDPFAMFYPLLRVMVGVIGCMLKMAWYGIRKIVD